MRKIHRHYSLFIIHYSLQCKRTTHRSSFALGSGSCLSSHAVSSTVLSVYVGLTSVFGMRTGGTPQLNHRKSFTGEKHLDRLDVFPCAQCFDWLRISRPAGPLKPLVSQYLDNCIRNVNSLRSSPRPISIAQLRTLLHFHLRPINHVVFMGSYSIKDGRSYLEAGFTLRCLQRLSDPHLATQLCRWHDN